mmetsp:Transcript_51530/g.102186  ORF Transcript_51530/g.102186 Transcript_51530/m.102186 type:complete len:202 (-) Transcript_51530:258-863(-)
MMVEMVLLVVAKVVHASFLLFGANGNENKDERGCCLILWWREKSCWWRPKKQQQEKQQQPNMTILRWRQEMLLLPSRLPLLLLLLLLLQCKEATAIVSGPGEEEGGNDSAPREVRHISHLPLSSTFSYVQPRHTQSPDRTLASKRWICCCNMVASSTTPRLAPSLPLPTRFDGKPPCTADSRGAPAAAPAANAAASSPLAA